MGDLDLERLDRFLDFDLFRCKGDFLLFLEDDLDFLRLGELDVDLFLEGDFECLSFGDMDFCLNIWESLSSALVTFSFCSVLRRSPDPSEVFAATSFISKGIVDVTHFTVVLVSEEPETDTPASNKGIGRHEPTSLLTWLSLIILAEGFSGTLGLGLFSFSPFSASLRVLLRAASSCFISAAVLFFCLSLSRCPSLEKDLDFDRELDVECLSRLRDLDRLEWCEGDLLFDRDLLLFLALDLDLFCLDRDLERECLPLLAEGDLDRLLRRCDLECDLDLLLHLFCVDGLLGLFLRDFDLDLGDRLGDRDLDLCLAFCLSELERERCLLKLLSWRDVLERLLLLLAFLLSLCLSSAVLILGIMSGKS